MIRKFWRALALVTVLALLMGCSAPQVSEAAGPAPGLHGSEVTYRGGTYRLRQELTTVLVMGLDKYERPEEVRGFTNKLQADFLMLLVIDEEAGNCEILHLNRDTITEIRSLGIGGATAGTFQGQLALAHTYGSGGSDSCLNAARAVSDLLCGIKIDHYMTLTMDAVGIINDYAGGVTLTLQDDMTDLDPELVKGREVTLEGEQALLYVRSRAGLDDSTNLHRMERQRQYMKALYDQIMARHQQDGEFLARLLLEVADSFVSDCTADRLEELASLLDSCTVAPIRTLKGKASKGEEYMEFHVDRDDLMETVVDLFCEPKE